MVVFSQETGTYEEAATLEERRETLLYFRGPPGKPAPDAEDVLLEIGTCESLMSFSDRFRANGDVVTEHSVAFDRCMYALR